MKHYHDTSDAGPKLPEYERKAKTQDERILILFEIFKRRQFSPEDVLRLAFRKGQRPPLTSVRRALTNLTNAGKLVKLDRTVEGQYGRPCHLWRLAREDDVKQMDLGEDWSSPPLDREPSAVRFIGRVCPKCQATHMGKTNGICGSCGEPLTEDKP